MTVPDARLRRESGPARGRLRRRRRGPPVRRGGLEESPRAKGPRPTRADGDDDEGDDDA